MYDNVHIIISQNKILIKYILENIVIKKTKLFKKRHIFYLFKSKTLNIN